MTTALPYRKSGLFRHMYADQTVCSREARDPGTGACVGRCKEMITGQSETFGLLLHFAQHFSMSELDHSLDVGYEWTQYSGVFTSGSVSRYLCIISI